MKTKRIQPVKKAYRVWVHSMIGEYPIFSPEQAEIVYAPDRDTARSKLYCWGEYENKHGEPARWIDINCKRVPEKDLFEHNGIPLTRKRIEEEMQRDKRNEKLKQLDETDMYYLQDARSYVGNCVLWHGKNSSGYFCDINEAHKYTKEEIVKKCTNGRETDIVWSARHIEQNIKQVVDMQYISSKYSV